MQAAGTQVVDYDDEDIPDEENVQGKCTCVQAVDLLEMLQREETMRKENDEDLLKPFLMRDTSKPRPEAITKLKVLRPVTCATFARDAIEGRANISDGANQPLFGPASLDGSSITERLAAQIFQPSHSLPTMSTEQARLKETEVMRKLQERNQQLFQVDQGSRTGVTMRQRSRSSEHWTMEG
ncbi:PP2A regulatory subunit TAP46-like isoform X2 [Selaginella moellendorffii]|uniref:PP2A regulatory subunit TAP46-like isoform X2 n=1 Tax=Selaginella moellendorffii TaxID=88036 RepID=UPI000D1CBEA9|nr:PP2A regulatory subunit TAP46-like isoform X2 [Selaginella moellendorffii]|eukprot:XP_024519577.1 PP2A regulatory subunit TAP46-like isoform X2 [Selaginella moellendorffii]